MDEHYEGFVGQAYLDLAVFSAIAAVGNDGQAEDVKEELEQVKAHKLITAHFNAVSIRAKMVLRGVSEFTSGS